LIFKNGNYHWKIGRLEGWIKQYPIFQSSSLPSVLPDLIVKNHYLELSRKVVNHRTFLLDGRRKTPDDTSCVLRLPSTLRLTSIFRELSLMKGGAALPIINQNPGNVGLIVKKYFNSAEEKK